MRRSLLRSARQTFREVLEFALQFPTICLPRLAVDSRRSAVAQRHVCIAQSLDSLSYWVLRDDPTRGANRTSRFSTEKCRAPSVPQGFNPSFEGFPDSLTHIRQNAPSPIAET